VSTWVKRLTNHARLRAVLDAPAVFYGFRFLLVGRQTATRELLRRYLDVRPGERVLDVCCGVGEFAGDVGGEYTGIDLNPRFVGAARRRYAGSPGKGFRVMDALRMDFPDRHFDKCLFVNGLHHFSDPDAVRVLSEIRRVTRDRAVIVDADGTPRGLARRILLASDRGDWMRTPTSLEQLVGSVLTVRESVRFRVGFYAELLFACDPNGGTASGTR
jgi:demethylmenaquinone methyltransferase/2-methoxy-6-polyprenyl-1,4-benzoquinol methylase